MVSNKTEIKFLVSLDNIDTVPGSNLTMFLNKNGQKNLKYVHFISFKDLFVIKPFCQ